MHGGTTGSLTLGIAPVQLTCVGHLQQASDGRVVVLIPPVLKTKIENVVCTRG